MCGCALDFNQLLNVVHLLSERTVLVRVALVAATAKR